MAADPYDRYFYVGTDVLRNKLDLTDEDELRGFEYAWVEINMSDARALARTDEVLGSDTLRAAHRVLLGDIYAWAGEYRTMPLFKGQTAFAAVVEPAQVDAAFQIFNQQAPGFAKHFGQFAGQLARLWGELNRIHPFVEGNGRATQIIVDDAARRHGWLIEWEKLDKWVELDAAIRSCMVGLGERRFDGYHDMLMRILKPTNERDQGDLPQER